MTKIIRYIYVLICTLTFTLLSVSCSKEIIPNGNGNNSKVELEGDYKISKFTIDNKHLLLEHGEGEAILHLFNIETKKGYSFTIKATNQDGKTEVAIKIPMANSILDGNYIIYLAKDNLTRTSKRLNATFKSDRLKSISADAMVYPLQGEGTSEKKPYIISDVSDYEQFLYTLSVDPAHGKGYFFKQANSLNIAYLDANNKLKPHYTAQPFAGTYFGADNTVLTLQYAGSGKSDIDDNIGMFKELLDGACVKDLNIFLNFTKVNNNCGAVAATVTGNATISSIFVSGSIFSANSNIGGLIGRVLSGAKLTVRQSYVSAVIEGYSNIGGCAGEVNGELDVDYFGNLRSGDYAYGLIDLYGTNCVGGVAGETATGSKVTLKNVSIINDIDEQDIGLEVLHLKGEYMGGLIGKCIGTNLSLEDCKVIAPMASEDSNGDYIGGLIGYYYTPEGANDIYLKGVRYGSTITGRNYIGGLFGYIKVLSNININSTRETISGVNKLNGTSIITGYGHSCGAFAGYIEASNAKSTINFLDTLAISTKIVGNDRVGSVAGNLYNADLNTGRVKISPETEIYGIKNIGGLFGAIYNSNITGRTEGMDIANNTRYHSKADMLNSIKDPADYRGWINHNNSNPNSYYIGGIVGTAENSTIKNYSFTGTIYGGEMVGGIVGLFSNTNVDNNAILMDKCYNLSKSNITTSGNSSIPINEQTTDAYIPCGGLIAMANIRAGKLEHLYNYCNLEINSLSGMNNYIGGIISLLGNPLNSESYKVTLSNLCNFGGLTIKNTENIHYIIAGGCIGQNTSNTAIITESVNCGTLNIDASDYCIIGGIIGTSYSNITNCANSGNLSIHENRGCNRLGGICGSAFKEVSECANRGDLSIYRKDDGHIGGIIGIGGSNTKVKNCYNMGDITSSQDSDNGGLIGSVTGDFYVGYSYNYGNVTKGNHIIGTHSDALNIVHFDWNSTYGIATPGNKSKNWKMTGVIDYSARNLTLKYEGFNFTEKWQLDIYNYNDKSPTLVKNKYQFLKYN